MYTKVEAMETPCIPVLLQQTRNWTSCTSQYRNVVFFTNEGLITKDAALSMFSKGQLLGCLILAEKTFTVAM